MLKKMFLGLILFVFSIVSSSSKRVLARSGNPFMTSFIGHLDMLVTGERHGDQIMFKLKQTKRTSTNKDTGSVNLWELEYRYCVSGATRYTSKKIILDENTTVLRHAKHYKREGEAKGAWAKYIHILPEDITIFNSMKGGEQRHDMFHNTIEALLHLAQRRTVKEREAGITDYIKNGVLETNKFTMELRILGKSCGTTDVVLKQNDRSWTLNFKIKGQPYVMELNTKTILFHEKAYGSHKHDVHIISTGGKAHEPRTGTGEISFRDHYNSTKKFYKTLLALVDYQHLELYKKKQLNNRNMFHKVTVTNCLEEDSK